MKFRFGILFLAFIAMAILSPGDALACGNHADADHTSKFHHRHEHHADHHDRTGNAPEHDHPASPDNEPDHHCHCPGCGGISAHSGGLTSGIQVDLNPQPAEDGLKKQAFYYAEHLPEDVVLPIWQPPKI